MLPKFFPARTLAPSVFRRVPPESSSSAPSRPLDHPAVKIVHMGGAIEYYYMAVPASRIMEKYPSFLVTRPTIFRRPWESLIRPEEILTPGEKFFVVPRRTVRKLQRRIRPLMGGVLATEGVSDQSAADRSISDGSTSFSKQYNDRASTKSTGPPPRTHRSVKVYMEDRRELRRCPKGPACKTTPEINNSEISNGSIFRRYMDRFSSNSTGKPAKDKDSRKVDADDHSSRSSVARPTYKPPPSVLEDKKTTKKTPPPKAPNQRQRKVRNTVMWSPTLPAIDEGSPLYN